MRRPGGEDLGQARAGLDVQRDLAIAELATRPGGPGTPLLVLPVGDVARLEAQVTRLVR